MTEGIRKLFSDIANSKCRNQSAKRASLVIIFCRYEMRSSFGRDSSDGYCVAFAQSLGHVLIAYTPVGLYAGSLSRPRLTPETSVVPAYSKFGDRNFAPNGAKREARYSGAALRAHAVVSPLKFSAESSLLLFCKQKKSNEENCGKINGETTACARSAAPLNRASLFAPMGAKFLSPNFK